MMADQKNIFSFSEFVNTGKDLVAMMRDFILLLLAVLLLAWPQAINSILVEAGFEEGSFAGLKWKAKFSESDAALLTAQATIDDLREQNEKLNNALSDVKNLITNPKKKEEIASLEQLNIRISENSQKVQAAVNTTTSANAQLVQQVQTSAGNVITWGVVFGGDRSLKDANYEIQTIAPKLGLTNAAIYYRQNSYRSVATSTDRLHAEQLLRKAKERQRDAYIVNMASWCPNVIEKEGHFICENN